MHFLLSRISRLVSTLMIVTYLATAMLVCDPEGAGTSWIAEGAAEVVFPAEHSHHPPEISSAEVAAAQGVGHEPAMHAGHQGHQGHTGHGMETQRPAAPSNARDHTHHAHAESKPTEAQTAPRGFAAGAASTSFRDLRAAGLEFAATCLCGCSETRSTVGGNTSRLGSVVPRVFLATVPELNAHPQQTPYAGRFLHRSGDLDPIPI